MYQPQGKVLPENERVSGGTTIPHQPLMQGLMAAGGTPLLVGTQTRSWLFRSKCNTVGCMAQWVV